MGNSRIEDNPSFKELAEDIHNLEQVQYALPLLKPFLRLFGVQVDQLAAAREKTRALCMSM